MKKLSVSLSGHQTSISLEDEFITEIYNIAKSKNVSVASIIESIDRTRNPKNNLSSAVRIWVLKTVKNC